MDRKILIIDDDEQDLKVMQRYLTQAGYEDITTAQTGEQGLEKFKEDLVDIVILDTNLPGISGFQVCQEIKALDKNGVKVIMMTGHAEAIDAKQARESGADEYCGKTSDYALLLEAIERL